MATLQAPPKAESLVERTALAIYLAQYEKRGGVPAYAGLSRQEHETYERMAVAALTVAYREPLEPELT